MKRPFAHLFILIACLLSLAACSDIGYYVQCATGHFSLMSRARPIDDVINDPLVTTEQRSRLGKVLEIRGFASAELGLPDNNSYRRYADIGRPYAVWNVVAAPEFSLEPKQWCFPIAGCVAYRGYFKQEAAEKLAAELAAEGYEVAVYGVQAYSTLNWFDDPVLNTFLTGLETRTAALIFHELAHQKVYVPGDTPFNEAFAKTVELEGMKRWLKANTSPEEWRKYLAQDVQNEQFQRFLGDVRRRLQNIYSQPLSIEEKRLRKNRLLEQAQNEYRHLRRNWSDAEGYDSWMAAGLNNARLASVATYREMVPAFQTLLAHHFGNLHAFYADVARLGQLPSPERHARLRNLAKRTLHARHLPEAGR